MNTLLIITLLVMYVEIIDYYFCCCDVINFILIAFNFNII